MNFRSWRSFCTQKSYYSPNFTAGGSNDYRRHCLLYLRTDKQINDYWIKTPEIAARVDVRVNSAHTDMYKFKRVTTCWFRNISERSLLFEYAFSRNYGDINFGTSLVYEFWSYHHVDVPPGTRSWTIVVLIRVIHRWIVRERHGEGCEEGKRIEKRHCDVFSNIIITITLRKGERRRIRTCRKHYTIHIYFISHV